jgi:ligand-binding sensor domain-containing protein
MNKLFVFFTALLLSVSTFSQQYNFINYSTEEGLAQSQIRALNQDDDGYIWIGTFGGLSKFDGVNFENFSSNDGLLSNQINSIFNDSKGNVWIGGQGGVSVYDGKGFKRYKFKEALSQNFILSIAEDKHGRIWFASDGGGVIYLQENKFNYLVLPNGIDNNYVRSIVIDQQENKWLATRNGLSIIDSTLQIKDTISNINATQVFVDDDKTVWCSTFGDGVLRLINGRCIKLNTDSGLLTDYVRGFTKRKDGSFWFVSKNGISKYESGVFKNFTSKDGLSQNNIKVVFEDEEGNLFFGSDGGGLIKFTNENFISYTQEDGLSSSVVMSILEDAKQNIWVSTYGKGVTKIDGDSFEKNDERDGLANNTVWCSLLAADNRIWFGTDDGVSVYDGKKFKTYKVKDGLTAKKVYGLSEDDNGNIWIGTKDGLSFLDIGKNKIFDYTKSVGVRRNVRFMYHETPTIIWFCSADGLARYDIEKGVSEVFDEA